MKQIVLLKMIKKISISILALLLSIAIVSAFSLITTVLNTNSDKIYAQASSVLKYTFKVDVQDNLDSIVDLIIDIENNEVNHFVDGYEINIPVLNSRDLIVFLSGNEENNVSSRNENGYENLKITFEKPVFPGEKKQLVINFKSNTLVKEKFGIKQLYIQKPFDISNNSEINYQVYYSSTFGEPSVNSANTQIIDAESGKKLLSTVSTNGIYIIWSSLIRLNMSSDFSLVNENNIQRKYLFNLPPDLNNQDVFYHSIKGGEFGVYDNFGNQFAQVQVDANSSVDVGYSANIEISGEYEKGTYPNRYSLVFNTESEFGKYILENTNSLTSNYDKLKLFNQILVNRMKPNKQSIINLNALGDLWKKLDGNAGLNAFEYSSLVVSFAEYLGLKGRINYGYIIMSAVEFDNSFPHVWCDIEIDDRSVLIDSFMEDISNVSYFDRTVIDRVKFGVWHTDQIYNPVLGLLSGKNPIQTKLTQPVELTTAGTIRLELDLADITYSGEFYEGRLTVDNQSNRILKFEKVALSGTDYTDRLSYAEELYKSALPSQRNIFDLNNLREPNFLFNGQKELLLEVKFADNDEIFEAVSVVNFVIDQRIFLISIGALLVVAIVTILSIKRLYFKHKFRYLR